MVERDILEAKAPTNGTLTCSSTAGAATACRRPHARTDQEPGRADARPVGAPIRRRRRAIHHRQFSDFQCGFCFRVNPTLLQLLDRYKGKVRVVFKHSPIEGHDAAPLAHRAAFAAQQQGKFWEMHDRIFANQRAMERESLLAHASALGLDVTRFTADLDSPRAQAVLDRDQAEAAKVGVDGTPTFFVNGTPLIGAQPIEAFAAAIDKALAADRTALRPAGSRPQTSNLAMLQAWRWVMFFLLPWPGPAARSGCRRSSPPHGPAAAMPIGVWGWAAPDERIEAAARAAFGHRHREGRWRSAGAGNGGWADELVVAGATVTTLRRRARRRGLGRLRAVEHAVEVRQAQDADKIAAADQPASGSFGQARDRPRAEG